MIFVTKTACWISKLLNCTIERGKSLTQVSSVTCLMRPWRFTIFNYRRSECLWLDKRTSSTLELLNLRVSIFRFGESTTNKQFFKDGFIVKYQKNNCLLFKTRKFYHYQL